MEKSPCDRICYIAAKNHNLFVKRNERENKKNEENAARLIVHSKTHSGAYRHPRYSYTWYTGVSQKQLPLTKVPGIQLLKNLSNLLFLCRLASVHFRNTLSRKMLSLLHYSLTLKLLFPIFLSLQFFILPL